MIELAVDVDAVAVFYGDATFKFVTWDNVGQTQLNKRFIDGAVYHVQTPGSQPNIVTLGGHDFLTLRSIVTGMLVRTGDFPPAPTEAFEHFFRKGSSEQEIRKVLPDPADLHVGGMEVGLYTFPFTDAQYDILGTRAFDKIKELRTATPPLDGTY